MSPAISSPPAPRSVSPTRVTRADTTSNGATTSKPSQPPSATAASTSRQAAAGPALAITNAQIHTASGPVIERGTIVLSGGRIAAVGADVQVPAGAKVIDAAGKIVTPGWIESSTNIGIVEISRIGGGDRRPEHDRQGVQRRVQRAGLVQPGFHGDPGDARRWHHAGDGGAGRAPATSSQGQGAVFDLGGEQVPQSVTRAPAAMFAALGEAGASLAGGSRASAVLRLREALQDAIDFSQHRAAWNAAQRRDYARGRLDLEALRPVIRGEMPLAVQANRASDMLAAIRLAEEFNLKLVLVGAAEGWMVADELAEEKNAGRGETADQHPDASMRSARRSRTPRGCSGPA